MTFVARVHKTAKPLELVKVAALREEGPILFMASEACATLGAQEGILIKTSWKWIQLIN